MKLTIIKDRGSFLRVRRSIRKSLFIANAAIITLTTAALVSYITLWGAGRLRADMVARLDDRADAARSSLDERLRKMDSVSVSVLYSKLVKERFVAYSRSNPTGGTPAAAASTRDEALVDTLFAIIGPTMPVQQINIYDLQGKGFGIGMDNRSRSIDPSTPWFGAAEHAGGSMVLSRPHADPDLRRYSSLSESAGDLFISHGRLLFDRYNTPIGVVEIEESCDELFREVGGQEGETRGETETSVYDADGGRLYPYRQSTDAALGREGRGLRLSRYANSELSGWTVEVSADEARLFAPLRSFVVVSVVIALGLLSLALALSFGAARRITRPISVLHGEITSLELGSLMPSEARSGRPGLARGPNEVEELSAAFRDMRSKLKRSIDSAIEAQRAEEQARLLALQSQMNPHFIYNTIATIGALAEDGQGKSAAKLCANLSDMLRYVSSQKATDAPATEELNFIAKYLACIGVRFGRRLSYSLDFDRDFGSIAMPRLLIQPLVENSVKYATTGEPPWFISVKAETQSASWSVLIEDDGPGFSSEAKERIDSRLKEKAQTAGGLELDGMGMVNIASRLKLKYGDRAVFEYGNLRKGGAFVHIGGPRGMDDAEE
jgi:two-component system sensor histidine kinase YesM